MTEARLQETLKQVLALARSAERRFAPIRDLAEQGSLGPVQFHERISDETAKALLKVDKLHAKYIAGRIWTDQAPAIRETFAKARRIITEASLHA